MFSAGKVVALHGIFHTVPDCSHHDDPLNHQGKTRSFPHVRGNWPTHVYIPGALTLQLYSCTVKQLFSYTFVQLYSCTVIQLYSCTVVQLYSYTVVQVYSCTVVQLDTCTFIQSYSCTIVQYLGCVTLDGVISMRL